jgi:GDP/UDP-N,N'-diacetylbacillosamine 2-epimerase (hydrolysing)
MEGLHTIMKKIKVLAITGIRSDYDFMSDVYKEISKNKYFDFNLIVTGTHCLFKFGKTINEIKKDKVKIIKIIKSIKNPDINGSRAISLGVQLQKITPIIIKLSPQYIFAVGDREESLVASIIGSYLDTPVVHFAGGDRVVGNVDDQVRHAVSKLSHLHITTNKFSANRLIRSGEQIFRIHNFGNPGIDRFNTQKKISSIELSKYLNFKLLDPFFILIYHPLSSEKNKAYSYMKTILLSLKETNYQYIVIYPNSDEGNSGVIKAINEFKNEKKFKIFKHLPRKIFINLLKRANGMIGNSSSGILEAPFLNLPVLNIGNRQKKRIHGNNVIFVNHNKIKIKKAIEKILNDKKFLNKIKITKNLFGNGKVSKKVIKLLKNLKITSKLLIKDITY